MQSLIRPMAKRKYAKIPVDRITVLNPRSRDADKFKENIRSIRDVGLLKPIVINERNYSKTGQYELVCGEGRYLAYKSLEYTEIPAEVINCDRKQAMIYSLVENIARVPPDTMYFAREIKRMHDSGCTLGYIANVTGRSEGYIADFIHLVEKGENRLIEGVEKNLFPMKFALQVARSDNANIQHVLMDAFDNGIVNSHNIPIVKRLINLRFNPRQYGDKKNPSSAEGVQNYTVNQLRSDIRKVTKQKEAFVNQVTVKENRLLTLLDDLNTLSQDQEFASLLEKAGLRERPQLQGNYNV